MNYSYDSVEMQNRKTSIVGTICSKYRFTVVRNEASVRVTPSVCDTVSACDTDDDAMSARATLSVCDSVCM
jgi:hypothetical protein